MTLTDQSRDTMSRAPEEGQEQRESQGSSINVGNSERAVSVAAGAILVAQGIYRRTFPGMLTALVGGAMLYRGFTGHCHTYGALGINTAEEDTDEAARETEENGIEISQAFLINKSAEELYRYWRNFENLPRFMSQLERVTVSDERRSHWVAKAPRIAGGQVEWDAEITRDEPNRAIAWRSLAGSDIDTVGEIRFEKALGDRGTEVHVRMSYVPPAGKVGHYVATLFGKNATMMVREDLRKFKRLMEIGEIPTIEGQPRGTCTGRGKREGA